MAAQAAPTRPSSDRRASAIQKRQSLLPKPASIFLDPTVLVAQHAQLTGTQPITIGPNAVLHPHSKISSALAPVVLGEGVVVYERVRIGLGTSESADGEAPSAARVRDSMRGDGTVLGRNVVVETGAVVEAAEVGEGSVVEAGAVLGRGCVLGKFCTVAASVVLPPNTQIPDFTVVYGGPETRVDRTLSERPEVLQARMLMHMKQLDMFKKLVPNNIAKWT